MLAQLEAIQKREADERARAARLEEENARLAQRNRELEQLQSGTLPALPSQQQQQQPRQRRSNDGDIKRVRAENKSLRDRNEELESQLAMLRAALHRKQRD